MIVREVLKNPSIIDRFDIFNDAGDTIRWLKSLKRSEADEVANKLKDAEKAYWGAKKQ